MKFNVHQLDLMTALSHLVRNTDNKNIISSLIKLEKAKNGLNLYATNFVVTMRYNIPNVEVEGDSVLLNARQLYEIITKLEGRITYDNGQIRCGNRKLKISEGRGDFVLFDEFEENVTELETENLFNTIKNRLFACEMTTTNVLSGLCLDGQNIVSCNGNILSLGKLNKDLPFEQMVISNKLANEMIKCFADQKTVFISYNNRKMLLKGGNITLISMLLEGKYPQYKQLIPNPEHRVMLNKKDLITSLDLLSVVCPDRIFNATFGDNKLLIQTNNNSGADELEINYADTPVTIGFNLDFMVNCLKNIDADEVEFGFTTPLNACLMQAGNELNLIMPVQLK